MDSRGVRASARKRLQRSSRSTDAAHSLVHLINCDGKHRRVWLRAALVRCAYSGSAQHDVFVLAGERGAAPVRRIGRGIRGTEKRDGGCTQRCCEMQRPRVAAYDACRAAQECHQLAKTAAIHERSGVTACGKQRSREIVVARSDVDDATQPARFAQLATQSSEALGGPAFGAPAAPWAYDDVAIKDLRQHQRTDVGLGLLRNLQADRSSAMLCSCA